MKKEVKKDKVQHLYVITMVTINAFRVLQRITAVIARNRINIEQMSIFDIKRTDTSHISVVAYADEKSMEKLLKQLDRIIELVEVGVSNKIEF